jgi:ankyrin repeat protein
MFNFKVKEDSVENFMMKLSKQDMIMNIVEKGDVEDMDKVKAYIMQDPKRNIFSKSEKRRYFVNEVNSEGYSLIYQASLNGHLNYVKLLLDCDADHLMQYGKTGSDKLSILDAAVRWNHLKVINYLLFDNEFYLSWPKEFLKSAIKIAETNGNSAVVKLLKKYMHKIKGGGCFFICG